MVERQISLYFLYPSPDSFYKELDIMLRTQPARSSICALKRCQQYSLSQCSYFSSSTRAAAISPHRNPGQILPSKQQKEIVRRGQSTAAQPAPYVLLCHWETVRPDYSCTDSQSSQTRPVPSPAFNQDTRRNAVHPLQNVQQPEMDES